MVLERLEACVLRTELEELQLKMDDQVQAIKLLEHVLVPDPLPRMIQLSVVTDSSACEFSTCLQSKGLSRLLSRF
jgi:hypothetical protein